MSGAPPRARADWPAASAARCDWPSCLSIAPREGRAVGLPFTPVAGACPEAKQVRPRPWPGWETGPGWGASGPPSAECRSRSGATPCPPFPTTAPPPSSLCHPVPHRGLQVVTLRRCHRHPVASRCRPRGILCPSSPACPPWPRGSAQGFAQGLGRGGQPEAAGRGPSQAVRGSRSQEQGSRETPRPCPRRRARRRAASRRTWRAGEAASPRLPRRQRAQRRPEASPHASRGFRASAPLPPLARPRWPRSFSLPVSS